MTRPAFAYIVDHPKRDLPGALSFARALAERGCDAYLVPLYDQATDVPLLPIDAIVVNFARPANVDLVRDYHTAGLAVFVMDTEGGNMTESGTNTTERLATLLDERGFSDYLAGYFFWGPRLRDAFAGHCRMPADALITTGCPRFDYASERWRAALRYPIRDYVLVNANYPLVNPRFVASESREREAAVQTGWDAGYMEHLVRDMREVFAAFKDTIVRLADDLSESTFVVRPHPFEDIGEYRRAFGARQNVIVEGEGNVLNVIANARCLVHLNCATAVEATMLNRLPISIEYLNTPRLLGHAPLPSRISAHASSYAHLLGMVRDTETYARTFPFERNYRDLIFPWFFENDGRAADRMADALLARVKPRKVRVSVSRSFRGSRDRARPMQRLQALAANLAGSLAVSRLRAVAQPVRRDKAFSSREVAASLARLCEIAGIDLPCVEHARHPLSGLPLASVVCRATHPAASAS